MQEQNTEHLGKVKHVATYQHRDVAGSIKVMFYAQNVKRETNKNQLSSTF